MGRFQNKPSIEWVQPRSTHACPLVSAIKSQIQEFNFIHTLNGENPNQRSNFNWYPNCENPKPLGLNFNPTQNCGNPKSWKAPKTQ
jgi:hypothetical protein